MADNFDAGRLHDGWAYAVTLRGGATLRFHDHDGLEAVTERWRASRAAGEGALLVFAGARAAAEDESGAIVIEPLDGQGAVLAEDVVAVRIWGPAAEVVGEAAVDAARAFLAVQRAAVEEEMAAAQARLQGAGGTGAGGEDDLARSLLGGGQRG